MSKKPSATMAEPVGGCDCIEGPGAGGWRLPIEPALTKVELESAFALPRNNQVCVAQAVLPERNPVNDSTPTSKQGISVCCWPSRASRLAPSSGSSMAQFSGESCWLSSSRPAPQNAAAHAPTRKFGRPVHAGLCMVMVILPMTLIGVSLIQEATAIYERVKSGQLNFGAYVQQVVAALPAWVTQLLERLNLTTLAELQQKLSSVAVQAGQFLASGGEHRPKHAGVSRRLRDHAVPAVFLVARWARSGASHQPCHAARQRAQELVKQIHHRDPRHREGQHRCSSISRCAGRTDFLDSGHQGPVLWGVLMAFLSLLPAVGAGLIWVPVAIYFLATGAILAKRGAHALRRFRHRLGGQRAAPDFGRQGRKMPDYVVLISTLGGMALFGLTGFVIGPVVAAPLRGLLGSVCPRGRSLERHRPAVIFRNKKGSLFRGAFHCRGPVAAMPRRLLLLRVLDHHGHDGGHHMRSAW